VTRNTLDGWTSLLTGVGVATRDKRSQTTFAADVLTDPDAMELWRGDDLAARAVELWPREMLREGWELCVQDEAHKDIAETVGQRCDELRFNERLREALEFCRAYGGGAVLLGINDGGAPNEPVNMKTVRSVDWLTTLEPRELVPLWYYSNPLGPKFGEPEVWQLNPSTSGPSREGKVPVQGTRIHESRLIIFNGIKVTRMQVSTRAFWGDSQLSRVWRVLRDFNAALDAAGILVTDFAQAVWKIADLAALVNASNSEALRTRMLAMEMSRSVLKAVVIGADEEFERKSTPVTGLPELIDRFATRLCAAFDAPLTLIFGESPGGLNATGASDIRFFYDRVAAQQTTTLQPEIKRFISLLFAAARVEPKSWSIQFRPLWQESAKEQAESRKIQAESDQIYMMNQVLTPEEVRRSRYGGDEYSYETQIESEAATSPLDAYIDPALADPAAMLPPGVVPPPAPAPAPTTRNPGDITNPIGSAGPAVGGTEVQKLAMNGAQVSALVDVIARVAAGELSRESGAAILTVCFPVDDAQALLLLGPENFEPVKPEPPPMPPGAGGGFPPKATPEAPPEAP